MFQKWFIPLSYTYTNKVLFQCFVYLFLGPGLAESMFYIASSLYLIGSSCHDHHIIKSSSHHIIIISSYHQHINLYHIHHQPHQHHHHQHYQLNRNISVRVKVQLNILLFFLRVRQMMDKCGIVSL